MLKITVVNCDSNNWTAMIKLKMNDNLQHMIKIMMYFNPLFKTIIVCRSIVS